MTTFTYNHPSSSNPTINSIARDAAEKLIEIISVLDFIPSNLHAAIRSRTSTTDVASYVQNAIDYIHATRNQSDARFYGAQLFFPRGRYILGSTLNLCKGLNLVGEGRVATFLEFTQGGTDFATGTALRMTSTLNGATQIYLTIRDISLVNTASSTKLGAGFWDTSGSIISITRATFYGFKYGIVLDQSELVDISETELSGMTHSGIWLVNGADLTTGSEPTFTNRIAVRACQINGNAHFGILDDGGACHAYVDNNFNGNGFDRSDGASMRIAGAAAVRIAGGEFEGAQTHVQLRTTRLSGGSVGGTSPTLISGCAFAPGGNPVGSPISCYNVGTVAIVGNFFGNTGSASIPCVDGVENLSGFYSMGNLRESPGPFTDAQANDQHVLLEAMRHGSATYDPPSLASGASTPVQTMTVAGVVLGDQVESASFSNSLAGAVLHAWVSGNDTVSYFIQNVNGANPLDLGSGTVRARVMKRIF